jgi:hypothetical protein
VVRGAVRPARPLGLGRSAATLGAARARPRLDPAPGDLSLGGVTKAMNRADRMAALFNLLPIVLGGYFDDSMLGWIVGLCDEQTDAILFLIRELGIGAAWAKFERAQADGTIGLMVPSDRAHLTKHRRGTTPPPGCGQDLGQELALSWRDRRDAQARIRDLSALMDEILASVNASPTRAVDLVLMTLKKMCGAHARYHQVCGVSCRGLSEGQLGIGCSIPGQNRNIEKRLILTRLLDQSESAGQTAS